ncbi:MAG: bifunctional aspartate kinase/homoserine dehydrogenase I [Bdellovibrionales bacterium]|nr:bifunctional aspartate kinase/homoserine dehydrogenase I [Bdellovibrionales bacterium]
MDFKNWTIYKFGGTSLGTTECFANIVSWVPVESKGRTALVVSAMAGVTSRLIELLTLAKSRGEIYKDKLQAIQNDHLEVVDRLLVSPENKKFLSEVITHDVKDISDLLHASFLSQSYSEHILDLVSGYGELWSAQILTSALQEAQLSVAFLDARKVLFVCDSENGPVVDWEISQAKMDSWINQFNNPFLVVTGFVASNLDGIPTTLKRNGSDFSAAIFGVLLGAREIIIWKDVDGVLSADPKRVPDAVVLNEMSYNEASELAYFGAKVIHPKTLAPAIRHQIPIRIRNSFNLEMPGTLIHSKSSSTFPVKGFSTIENVALINVEGTGMLGVPGVASRLFGALREVKISVIMISQASSEHSICFVVPQAQAADASTAANKAFHAERLQGFVQKIDIQEKCCVLAAVGDNMAYHPGTAGKFFSALGEAKVNVKAIAQGSSERNISIVIDQADATRGLQAVHSAFYLSRQTVSIGLIGPGQVGATLLQQLASQTDLLHDRLGVDFRLRAIANTTKMLLSQKPIDLNHWQEIFQENHQAFDLEKFLQHIRSDSIPHAALVDCTASSTVSESYPTVFERGIHIVTPNKKANSGPLELYYKIREAAKKNHVHYLYEGTVGAGLPLINTCREFVQTGDKVFEIEGIFSGTLSYLFNLYDGSKPFSELVLEARSKGYTEPDPRDDLSGTDVARKLVILGREAQFRLNIEDVDIQNLIPLALRAVDLDEFMVKLAEYDSEMDQKIKASSQKGEVLRYVGRVDSQNRAEVVLRSVPQEHAFGRITGTDNIVAFKTRRYYDQPLIVQGPGAGPEVTAGGVFADLLKLAYYLGAPSQL